MKVTYDPIADASYLALVDIPAAVGVARTVAVAHEGINLDFNADGRLVGIEVLNAEMRLPASLIAT